MSWILSTKPICPGFCYGPTKCEILQEVLPPGRNKLLIHWSPNPPLALVLPQHQQALISWWRTLKVPERVSILDQVRNNTPLLYRMEPIRRPLGNELYDLIFLGCSFSFLFQIFFFLEWRHAWMARLETDLSNMITKLHSWMFGCFFWEWNTSNMAFQPQLSGYCLGKSPQLSDTPTHVQTLPRVVAQAYWLA